MQEDDEILPIDDDTVIEALAEVDVQERIGIAVLNASISSARTSILSLFARQRKLAGDWRLADNKRELIKVKSKVTT
jgi:hypothetical protein